jgi:hypothetical protein
MSRGLARGDARPRVAVQLPAGPGPAVAAAARQRPAACARGAGLLGGTFGLALLGWALWRQEGRSADACWAAWASAPSSWPRWWVSGVLGHLAEHPLTLEETFLATNTRAWSR